MPTLIFVLRVLLGGVFLLAGLLKAGHPAALAVTITAFRLLPAFVVVPLAVFLPFFEIGLGVYLVLGLFTRAVASLVCLQLVVFAGAIASVVARGIVTSCGCFGPADSAPASWWDVGRDLALACLSLAIVRFAPGRWALDARL